MNGKPNIKIRDWVESLANRGRISFSLSQLLSENPDISETAVRSAISRLSNKGKVISIHKGFYLIITADYALRGIIPPIQFIDDLMKYLNRPYYVGTVSAAALYGAAHQAPQEFFVVTVYPAMRPTEKKGIKISYISKSNLPEKLLNKRKTRTGYVKVSSEALTAIELVQYHDKSGGLSLVATILYELMKEIQPESFSEDLLSFSTVSAIQRLGYLLEYELDNKLLADSLFENSKQYGSKFQRIPLRQSTPFKAVSSDNRWRVAANVKIEIDEI